MEFQKDAVLKFDNKSADINMKNCSLSIMLSATNEKPQKLLQCYTTHRRVDTQAMLHALTVGNVIFFMMFAFLIHRR